MVSLPGWVPRRDDFIEFDHLDPQVVFVPPGAQLRAWPKLRELERRWLHFEWFAVGVAKKPFGIRTLLDDGARAYLMTFEAALQIIGDQIFPGKKSSRRLNRWLRSLPTDQYDITCRGLRTLRHVEAHVRSGDLEVVGSQLQSSLFSGPSGAQILPWCFPQLVEAERPAVLALDDAEIPEWNSLCKSNLATTLMRRGIARLFEVGKAAERVVSDSRRNSSG